MRHAVILAGGSGVRFWPLSRRRRPKQFLPLADGASLLRKTYERLVPLVPPERTWVVTSRSLAARVRRELPEIGAGNILREPLGRNTAPAILLAAHAASRQDPEATLLVVPADAWVPRAAPYRRALGAAFRAAEGEDRLVLIGVRPTRAETGYGYIEPRPGEKGDAVLGVRRFLEKPTLRRARRFLAQGRHLWNCGIFAWRADTYRKAVRRHLPELDQAFAGLEDGRITARAVDTIYRAAPSISVDVGILEKARNVSVVPASFAWDDLGSWRALAALGKDGGFRHGSVVSIDSEGLIVWAERGTVAALGVSDLVIVHTPDATLVAPKERAQEVRDLVVLLEKTAAGRRIVEE